ncbi:MAG: glycosyltransferase [Oscillospiraceae bacterium]|nr:glycosyltransferase [Oscillospiraceae bacterium]
MQMTKDPLRQKGLILLKHKLSIVMPVYNGGDLLIKMLDALCAQTFRDFELIVVNDGSKDDTAGRLAAYAAGEPRLRPVTVENGGPSRARNTGIAMAEGEYLYLCDADDLPECTLLEKLVKAMDEGADLAVCGFVEEREDGKTTVSTPFPAPELKAEDHAAFLAALPELMAKQLMFVNWNKMYRLDTVKERNVLFTEEFASCEDRLFNLAYYAHTEKLTVIGETLFHYYVRGGSLNSKFLPSRYDSLVRFDETLEALYERGGALTGEVREKNARIFVKGVMASLASLHHPSCPLDRKGKRGYIRGMLESPAMKKNLAVLSGGISWKVIRTVLRTGFVPLIHLMGWAVDFSARKLPGLVRLVKGQK